MATFSDALEFLKKLDLDKGLEKIKNGVDVVQTGAEMASAAFDKPEVALAGLLRTFAKRAMGKQLDTEDARDISRMVVKAIKKSAK